MRTSADWYYAKSTAAWKRLCIGAVRLGLWLGLFDVDVEEPACQISVPSARESASSMSTPR